jgi:hypothetical protein
MSMIRRARVSFGRLQVPHTTHLELLHDGCCALYGRVLPCEHRLVPLAVSKAYISHAQSRSERFGLELMRMLKQDLIKPHESISRIPALEPSTHVDTGQTFTLTVEGGVIEVCGQPRASHP